MPFHQRLERGLIAGLSISGQQLTVAKSYGRSVLEQVLKVAQSSSERSTLPWLPSLSVFQLARGRES